MTQPPTLSYAPPRSPNKLERLLLRPLGWPFYTLCLLILFFFLWNSLLPDNTAPFQWFLITYIVPPLWFIRFAFALTLRRHFQIHNPPFPTFLIRFALPLLLPTLMLALSASQLLPPLGLALARPSMDRLVTEIRTTESTRSPAATQPTLYPNRFLGPYYAYDITYNPDTQLINFYIEGAGETQIFNFFADSYGYAHSLGPFPSASSSYTPNTRAPNPVKQIDTHWWYSRSDDW